MHQLPNQLLSVIILPNCYPGRCGGWERISREDMAQQSAKEESGNILKCARHQTALIYSPLRKRAPENLLKALRMHSELPLEPCEFFFGSAREKHKHSSFPTFFSVRLSLLGIKVLFLLRFLFANCSLVASGESVDSVARSTAIDDLAKMDAHSAGMA